jgi:hypothetical protein
MMANPSFAAIRATTSKAREQHLKLLLSYDALHCKLTGTPNALFYFGRGGTCSTILHAPYTSAKYRQGPV